MVLLLSLCLSHTAQAFYLDNSTVLQPTPLSTTFKVADWYNITESLTIDVKGIKLNDYWLESAPNETTNLTVHNYSELYREFNIFNTSGTPYLEFNISGLNRSTAAEIYADFVLAANITTNSSGWLNFVLDYGNLTNTNTTIIINQTINNTQAAAVTPPVTPPGGGLLLLRGRNITAPNCSFELYPSKLIGTGTTGSPIDPDFTMYIKNLYINQSYTVSFDWSAALSCYIDCMTPDNTSISNITVSSSGGCEKVMEVELQPTADVMTEIEVTFNKMSFGDIEGFLASKIMGISVIIWLLLVLIIILLMILILSTIVIGGNR